MTNEKNYTVSEVSELLNVSEHTLASWYRWEKRRLADGLVESNYLPEPIRDATKRGKPRFWTDEMVKELADYKSTIIIGRNGVNGMYSNPLHKQTKKYKKSHGLLDNE
ncbi:MAG: hypothetical protein ACI4E1_07740 [Lachnospira sp.]